MMKNIDFFAQSNKHDGHQQNGLQFKTSKRKISRNFEKSKSSISEQALTNNDISSKGSATQNQIFYPSHHTMQAAFQCLSPIKSKRKCTLENESQGNKFRNTVATEQQYRCRRVKRQQTETGSTPFSDRTNYQLNNLNSQLSSNRNQRFHTLHDERNHFSSRQSNKFKSINSHSRITDKLYSLHATPSKNKLKQPLNKSQKSVNNLYHTGFQKQGNEYSSVMRGRETANHLKNRSEKYEDNKVDDQRNAPFSEVEMREVSSDRGQNCYDFSKKRALSRVNSANSIKAAVQFYSSPKINQFQLGLCLSEDIFGKTYPARHIPTGLILCIKIVNKREVKFQLQRFIECVKIQSFLNRPQLVEIYSVFSQHDKIYLLMQYHNPGPLLLKMKSTIKTSPKDYLAYFYDICCGINDFHLLNIVCRNLKPENISFFHDTCKISNFCSISHVNHQKGQNNCAFEYCAPEILNGAKYCKQSQLWALGVLFFEMLTGSTPYQNMSRRQAKDKILQSKIEIPASLDQNIARILTKMLMKQPRQRILISQLLKEIERTTKFLECFPK